MKVSPLKLVPEPTMETTPKERALYFIHLKKQIEALEAELKEMRPELIDIIKQFNLPKDTKKGQTWSLIVEDHELIYSEYSTRRFSQKLAKSFLSEELIKKCYEKRDSTKLEVK